MQMLVQNKSQVRRYGTCRPSLISMHIKIGTFSLFNAPGYEASVCLHI